MSNDPSTTPGLEANPGTDSPEELQQLAELVAEALGNGESREKVITDLVENGWDERSADKFVRSVEQVIYAQPQPAGGHADSEGGGFGWLIWIGALLLINGLSYVFNWGFWLY